MFEKAFAKPSYKRKIDIFLRTCSNTGIINEQFNKSRCISEDREIMILKCISSLVNSISKSKNNVKLWIIDDHSSDSFLKILSDIVKYIDYEIISLKETGYISSGIEQGRLCKEQGSDIVYLIEDDYFHCDNAIDLMADGLIALQKSCEWNHAAIYPYDCIDRYKKEFPQPTRIFYDNGLYWRTVTKSTVTVMMHHSTFLNCFSVFDSMFKNYDPTTFGEDHSINRLWSNMVEYGPPIVMFSPIPSLAVHLEHQLPTTISKGLINWKETWDNFNT